ncbi:MAG: UDP-N-acetylmuramate dehydrogenase [Clostridia bacterium]
MEKSEIYKLLTKELEKSIVKIDEPMKAHTNFKIGGNADIFVIAKSIEDIQTILKITKEYKIPLTVLGNGSNVLVSDKGIRGIILKIALNNYVIEKQQDYAKIEVEAGVLLGMLSQILLKEQIANFEFAAGIPGTIGGAIRMNAGAYGGEIKDIVKDVTYLDENAKLITISNEQCMFSYRHSIFSNQKGIIVKATLQLPDGNKEEIKQKMEEFAQSRKEKQPIHLPSAGSTFKRGEDFITAKLIDECGLKGYKVGDAQVSTMHAGFVVNLGEATATDVLNVIEYVKQVVLEKTGKKIELEIELLGDF